MTSINHIPQTSPERVAVKCLEYTERRAWLLFDAGGELFRYQCRGGPAKPGEPARVPNRREVPRVRPLASVERPISAGGAGSRPSDARPRTARRAARFVS